MLTYEQQLDLVQKKLATAKTVGNLTTFKYARRVMYDYLWNDHPELLECRGHTYDNTNGKLVLAAPRKSFNYLENGTWDDVPDDQPVIAYKKFNGFMATASMYNGELVVGTTGTTGSDYAKMARKHIEAFMSSDLFNHPLEKIPLCSKSLTTPIRISLMNLSGRIFWVSVTIPMVISFL